MVQKVLRSPFVWWVEIIVPVFILAPSGNFDAGRVLLISSNSRDRINGNYCFFKFAHIGFVSFAHR